MPALTKGPIPLYYQIQKILRDKIISHQLPIGSQLPTEMALCKQFDVSRSTVRQALKLLENSGLIKCEQGRGTTVLPRNAPCLFGILQGPLNNHLLMGLGTQLTILSNKLVLPDEDVRMEMRLQYNEKAYLLECLRTHKSHKNLLVYSHAHLPRAIGDTVDADHPQDVLKRFKQILSESTTSIGEHVACAKAGPTISKHIKIQTAEPVLRIKRLYYSSENSVLLRAVSYFPANAYELNTEVTLSSG